MIIILVSALVVLAYLVADGSPLWSALLSGAIAFILCVAYGALDVQLFSLAWLTLYIGVQFLLPMADNKQWFAGWQIGRLRLAVAIV